MWARGDHRAASACADPLLRRQRGDWRDEHRVLHADAEAARRNRRRDGECDRRNADSPNSKFSSVVRFAADVLNGVPSIVMGIFAYGLIVLPVKRFSALAGGVA